MAKKITKNKMNWQPISFEFHNDSEDLIGIEECVDYKLEELFPKNLKRKLLEEIKPCLHKKLKTFKKKRQSKENIVDTNDDVKLHNLIPSKEGCTENTAVSVINNSSESVETLNAWDSYLLPKPLIQALLEQGFEKPTQIQALTLPPAIMGCKDILGCAETGSGKTLAFGLPILTSIYNMKNEKLNAKRQLYALILTPTRELAIQIKNHLTRTARYMDVKIMSITGGLAAMKQERILKKQPEIIVATPGRLWEFIETGNEYLTQLDQARYLVIDEADRMVEKGHFKELELILGRFNTFNSKQKQRQNFVFSATLTFTHELPKYLLTKRNVNNMTSAQKLQKIIATLGIAHPKVVDITDGAGISGTLVECCIICAPEEKDYYLYYLLRKHPGRTLIFCNSISCVKRLSSVLRVLGLNAMPLHASMQQRQRLKNLDKFNENENCILVATDVAARGLDIPHIDHVLHYQTPRTGENYIHRSGRTARAFEQGITILLIEFAELSDFTKLCRTLGKKNLPTFPVQDEFLNAVKSLVKLAVELDKMELALRKSSKESRWFQKITDEMDIINENVTPKNQLVHVPRLKKQLDMKRRQLANLLAQSLFKNVVSGNCQFNTVNVNNITLLQDKQKEEKAIDIMRAAIKTIPKNKNRLKSLTKLGKDNDEKKKKNV